MRQKKTFVMKGLVMFVGWLWDRNPRWIGGWLLALLVAVVLPSFRGPAAEPSRQGGASLPPVSLPPPSPEKPDREKPITTKLDVGPVAVDVDVARSVFTLAEVVEISVTMTSRPHVEIEWPKIPESPDHYKVLGTTTDGPDRLDKFDLRRWYARLEPLRLGPLQVADIPLRYKSGKEDWETGLVPIPRLEIVPGPSSSADPASLRSLPELPTPVDQETGSDFLSRALRWGGVAMALAVLLAAARSRFRRGAPVRSPREDVLAALSELEDRGIGIDGERAFVSDVTALVRAYLESAYGLEASRQSTPEFLANEAVRSVLTSGQQAALEEFLAAADIEKFASRPPTVEEARLCLRRARGFLAGEKIS